MNNKDISIPNNLQRTSPYENDYSAELCHHDLLTNCYDAVGVAYALADTAFQMKEYFGEKISDEAEELREMFRHAENLAVSLAQAFAEIDAMDWAVE